VRDDDELTILAQRLLPNANGVPVPGGSPPVPVPLYDVEAWGRLRYYGDRTERLVAADGPALFAIREADYRDTPGVLRAIRRLRALAPRPPQPHRSIGYSVSTARVEPGYVGGTASLDEPGFGEVARLSADGQALTIRWRRRNLVYYRRPDLGAWEPAAAGSGAPGIPLAVGDDLRATVEGIRLADAHADLGREIARHDDAAR